MTVSYTTITNASVFGNEHVDPSPQILASNSLSFNNTIITLSLLSVKTCKLKLDWNYMRAVHSWFQQKILDKPQVGDTSKSSNLYKLVNHTHETETQRCILPTSTCFPVVFLPPTSTPSVPAPRSREWMEVTPSNLLLVGWWKITRNLGGYIVLLYIQRCIMSKNIHEIKKAKKSKIHIEVWYDDIDRLQVVCFLDIQKRVFSTSLGNHSTPIEYAIQISAGLALFKTSFFEKLASKELGNIGINCDINAMYRNVVYVKPYGNNGRLYQFYYIPMFLRTIFGISIISCVSNNFSLMPQKHAKDVGSRVWGLVSCWQNCL